MEDILESKVNSLSSPILFLVSMMIGIGLPETIVIILWLLFSYLIPALIIGAIVLIVYRAVKKEGGGKALEILKERYARGEITREEYLRMKKDLES